MDIAKDILDRIGQPESELLEYKAVLPPAATVAQLIAGFANTKGGAIVLGVVDQGVGVLINDPGTGCAAVEGFNRMHAMFGQTDEGSQSPRTCIAVHPSDMAVAMAAHEAVIVIESAQGTRRVAFEDLHRLPANDPSRDTNLASEDLIVAMELPAFLGKSHYLKVRDRASYAYALVSCATAIEMDGDRIARARIALGSVAHKPWRLFAAEAMLQGERPNETLFRRVAEAGLEGARTYAMNGYKPELARVLVARGLSETTGLAPLQGPAGTAFAASVGGIAGVGEEQ